jgi:lysyl-tRNA synthetase class 2
MMLQGEQLQSMLKRRAKLLANVRRFFSVRNVLEVSTPILSSAAPTAPYLDSFSTHFSAGTDSKTLYLHTSPEFAMKRLLAAGSGAIYQIATVFRNGELGR